MEHTGKMKHEKHMEHFTGTHALSSEHAFDTKRLEDWLLTRVVADERFRGRLLRYLDVLASLDYDEGGGYSKYPWYALRDNYTASIARHTTIWFCGVTASGGVRNSRPVSAPWASLLGLMCSA